MPLHCRGPAPGVRSRLTLLLSGMEGQGCVDPDRAPPTVRKTGRGVADQDTRSAHSPSPGSLSWRSFYTLYFARDFFLPIVLAVLLDFLLSPLIRAFKRARIPEPLGAALVILGLLGVAGGARSTDSPDPPKSGLASSPPACVRRRIACRSCAGRSSR